MRLSYFKNQNGSAEVLEENNFYPFGLKHEGYNAGYNNPGYNPGYKYGYNHKELQEETGWNDYGARMYMSDIARWGVIDPLAETSRSFSPHHYAGNNPVSFIDPDGRKAVPAPYEGMENHLVEGSYMWQMAGGSFNPHQKVPNGGGSIFPVLSGGGGSYSTFGQTPAYAAMMNAWRNGQNFNLTNKNGYLNWNTLDTANANGMLDDESIGGMTAHSFKLQNTEPKDYSGTIMMAGLTASGVLLADDVTVVGVGDDVAIPPILAAAALAAVTAKATYEIMKIVGRQKGPQGVQYSLQATTSGLYPVYSFGSKLPTGTKFLNAGDVWKYGETINPETRYSETFKNGISVQQFDEFSGSQMQIKIVEKSKIYGYFFTHGELPAGNKIFR